MDEGMGGGNPAWLAMMMLFISLVIAFAHDMPLGDVLLVKGAAMLIRVPLQALVALASLGPLFVVAAFLGVVFYLRSLHGFLGTPVYYFVVVAAVAMFLV